MSFLNRMHYQREPNNRSNITNTGRLLKNPGGSLQLADRRRRRDLSGQPGRQFVYTDNTACPFSLWLASESGRILKNLPEQKPHLEKLEQSHTSVHATFSTMRLAAEQTAGTTGSVRSAFQGSLLPSPKLFSTQLKNCGKPSRNV
jgi:hypothetical protein